MTKNLNSFGYAPGGYMGRKCNDCSVVLFNVDKYAWRCESCAQIKCDEYHNILDNPLICDYDENKGIIYNVR